MLIFSPQRLAFLAVPKTGTTAIEMALRPHADILFAKRRKHVTATRFANKIAPFLHATLDLRVETFAVIRDPISQIRSWYRYRSGPRQAGTAVSTGGCSFDDFVRAVIAPDPPDFAGIGSQHRFLTSGAGDVLVTHLFAYETPQALHSFVDSRFGQEITFGRKNVSPPLPAPLSAEVEAQLRAARAAEFALYERVMQAGGHLTTA